MTFIPAAVAALLAALGPAPAPAAAALDDGAYGCTISGMFLGAIAIRGDSYSGPAYDGKWEAFYPFEVTDAGTINWGGPLGGISEAGTVVSTVLRQSFDRIGFDIMIQNERGNFQTISCAPG